MLVSGTGAVATFVVMLVFIVTKFSNGAWAIVLLIPSLVWLFFRIHRHYKETAARLRLDKIPVFLQKPILFDPARHDEVAIYFCESWSKLAVTVVSAILKRGLPVQIIHISVDPRRAAVFDKRSQEIAELNGWPAGIIRIIDEPYRDLMHSAAETLADLRTQYPHVYFEVYIGALRTHFPYSLLHMTTDRFLRDVVVEGQDVALNVKMLDLDMIPLPPGFKVTFEHATDHDQHHEESAAALKSAGRIAEPAGR